MRTLARVKTLGIDRFTIVMLALGILGGVLILLREATYGVGLTVDSVSYIATARNLLAGMGFVQWNGVLFLDSAPFFPLALAFAGLYIPNVVEAAGFVNAVAFGLNLVAMAVWLRSRVQSRWLVLWASSTCLLSLSMARLAATALTEPLFILFITLSLFTLDRFLTTRRSSFLFLAATCAALACLTRYIGVALVASSLLLLTIQRATLRSTIGNAAIYSLVSMTPLGVWMARNFLISGTLAGKSYPDGFSLLIGIQVASEEFVKLMLGETSLAYLHAWFETMLGIASIGPLLASFALITGAGLALAYLHWQKYSLNTNALAVPVVFISVYALFLAVSLPLTDVRLHVRYLVPMYVPALVVVALLLDLFLRYVSKRQFSWTLPLVWSSRTPIPYQGRETASLPTFILAACLSFLLLSQVSANYGNIQHWLDNGNELGYSSRPWANSEIVQYLRRSQPEGEIWSNEARALYLLTGVQAKHYDLPFDMDDVNRYIQSRKTQYRDIYIVWFYNLQDKGYHFDRPYPFGLAEVDALPELKIEAVLGDGVIYKIIQEDPN